MTVVCIVLFIILCGWQLKWLIADQVEIGMPREKGTKRRFTGLEATIILMFATAWIGLTPVLSIRLAFLECLCVLGIFKCSNRLPISFPIKCYILFIIWGIAGICYGDAPGEYGVRMLLKYIYPLLFALLCAKVVRRGDIFLYSGQWGRYIGTIGIILIMLPIIGSFAGQILWYRAAFVTGLTTYIVYSMGMYLHSNKKKQNLIWAILLCLPCIISVFRTNILGTATAISMFSIIKYKLKALPIVFAIGILGLCIMFYIPTVKNKMFINPDAVEISDYLSGDIDETNIETNYRKFMWEDVNKRFYDDNKLIGCGTGTIQNYFYNVVTDARRGGQLHNDFLVIRCDNGNVGLFLFIATYVICFLHCLQTYYRYKDGYIRLCAIVAGASLWGVMVTMFSDNTISYSMVTLSIPWGFYGMMLGLKHKADCDTEYA